MTVKQKKQLDEKIVTGGGATGVAHTADPVTGAGGAAQLPASHLGNGEKKKDIAHIQPGEGEQETSTENNTKPTKDTAGVNKASISTKASAATPGQTYSFTPNKPNGVSEDVEAMFSGTDLSEEFKEKAVIIFEAAVAAKVNEVIADLEEQYNTALAENTQAIEADLTEKVDQYMDYVAEQWLEQNQVAVESSLKTEITESFINDLRALFETHNIALPEETIDVVAEMQEEMSTMQAALDESIEQNIALTAQLGEALRKDILADVAEGLAATQAEKLAALAEGVEFDSAEGYRKKLEIVKENYFPADKPAGTKQNLLEEVNEEVAEPTKVVASSPVAFYAQAISRTTKK